MNAIAKVLGGFALAVGGFAGGFVTNYYVDYRGSYVTSLNANYEHFTSQSDEIMSILREFALVANGEATKSADNVAELERRLLAAVSTVEDLSRRLQGGSSIVSDYNQAALGLRSAAMQLEGPGNGKIMLKAAEDYLLAERSVRDAVLSETSEVW